jgi:hypothetical protein
MSSLVLWAVLEVLALRVKRRRRRKRGGELFIFGQRINDHDDQTW